MYVNIPWRKHTHTHNPYIYLTSEIQLKKKDKMTCGLTCLKNYCMTLGSVLLIASLAALGFCLYLLFDDPVDERTQYTSLGPNWENLGMYILVLVCA